MVPLVTVEPFPADPQHADVLNEVLEGRADEQLQQLARAAANARPQLLLIRWGHEMDLTGLYPWSTSDAASYRAAYRHVVSVFQREGASNVRWVWSPSGNTTAREYYPGDDVVDYVGMTLLGDAQWDQLAGVASTQTFPELLTPKYQLLAGYNKPMVIAELGVSGTRAYQQAWLVDAAGALPRFPLIRVVCYQNAENAPNNRMPTEPDWRIPPAVFSAFRDALDAAYAG